MQSTKLDRKALLRATAAVLIPLLATPLIARAGTYTYTGTGTTGIWTNTANWTNTTVPGNDDTAQVGQTTQTTGHILAVTMNDDYSSSDQLAQLTLDSTGVGGPATINQSAALSSMYVSGYEYIGYSAAYLDSYNQSGGTNTTGDLSIANNSGTNGSYSLSGSASLSVTNNEYVGNGGTGAFIQSGGTNTTSEVEIGANSGSAGSYTLSGTGVLSATSNELVGYNGSGVFIQSGGTNTTFELEVGYASGTGSYTLSAGTLSVTNGSNALEVLGQSGTGNFSQSGGTNTTSFLAVGTQAPATYTMSSGTVNLTGGYNLFDIGSTSYFTSAVLGYASGQGLGDNANGVGTMNQSGGMVTAATGFIVGFGGTGTYNLSGTGNLTVNGDEFIGGIPQLPSSEILVYGSGAGTFTQTGGTHVVTGTLNIGSDSTSTGTYNLQAGTLSPATLELYSGGTFNFAGGTLFSPSFNQVGGTETGAFVNPIQSTFNYSSGTFSGSLNNQGAFNVAGTFNAAQGFINNGTTTVAAGATLSGYDVYNQASLVLSGGTLALAGNAPSGSTISNNGNLTGYGTIASPITNNGVITQSGGTLTISQGGGSTNFGIINMAPGLQLVVPASSATSGMMNSGTIALNGGTLTGYGIFTNQSGGVVSGSGAILDDFQNENGTLLASGGTIQLAQGLYNNGLLELEGGNAGFTGGSITNNSYIQGAGSIANSITNLGIIQPTGNGTLYLASPVTNTSLGILTASTGNDLVLAQGLTSNTGLISLTGGTVDTGSFTLTNNGTLSGYGVLRSGGLANSGTITFSGGTATVDGSVTNNSGSAITVQAGTAVFNSLVTNNGSFTVGTGGNATFVSGYSGGAITNNGAIALQANSNSGDIRGTGTLAIGQTSAPAMEQIATNSGVSTLAALAIATGSQFDLTNNDLIVHNGNLSQIQSLIDSGYGGGAENGSGIITSTGHAANRTLGVMLNNNGDGQPIYTTFDGQAVTDTDVLVKYTLFGDANLDGTVDAADFVLLSNNFGKTGTTWSQGNFNDDGITDAADFVLLSNNFGQSLTSSAVQYMDATEIAAYNQIATDYGFSPSQIAAWDVKLSGVPEPGSLALGVVGAAALLQRRNRRRETKSLATAPTAMGCGVE